MKPRRKPQNVSSTPNTPHEEADKRVRRYAIMMTIRVICFILMAVVTPYGWYTWVFALGAAVLPYIAVILANAIDTTATAHVESPARAIATIPPQEQPLVVVVVRESGTAQ